MSEWKTYKLGDLIEINKNSINKNYSFSEIEYIDTSSVTENRFEDVQKITIGDAPSRAKRIVKENDIIYSTVRPILRHYGIMKNPKPNTVASTGFAVLSSINIDPYFLYYYLTTDEIVYFLNSVAESNTTTYPAFNASLFNTIKVTVPSSIEEQKEIAQILTSIDDKIEINLQMNQTLEAMAQAIFKEWFVDFNFPGFDDELVDGLPKGWRLGIFDELVEFINGYAFKSTDLSNSITDEDFYHVFKMGHIKKGGGLNFDGTKSYYPKSKALKLDKYILKKGDLLMCMTDMKDNVALLGHTALMNENDKYIVNQRVGLIRTRNNFLIDYPYLFILTNNEEFIHELRSRANRGVQVNLSTAEIRNTAVVIPPKIINEQFDSLMKPIFEKMFSNIEQIQALTQTRDTLLPKLMSGLLEVV